MVVFRHKEKRFTVGLNPKVLYSFFTYHPQFERCESLMVDFFLVRNPYARTLSAFNDKCRKRTTGDNPQPCQTILLRILGWKTLPDLLNLSFETFCEILPAIYMADEHFIPQTHNIGLYRVATVVKIENGLPALSVATLIDFSEKVNPSPADTVHTEKTKGRVLSLYALDFIRLGYQA